MDLIAPSLGGCPEIKEALERKTKQQKPKQQPRSIKKLTSSVSGLKGSRRQAREHNTLLLDTITLRMKGTERGVGNGSLEFCHPGAPLSKAVRIKPSNEIR